MWVKPIFEFRVDSEVGHTTALFQIMMTEHYSVDWEDIWECWKPLFSQ